MRYLFFTNTPAHVHLYKHVVERLTDRGHETAILARDYGCTTQLLDWEGLSYEVYGRCGTSQTSLLTRLPFHYYRIARHVRRVDPDLVFGMGGYAAHAGLLSRTPTVLVLDSEPTSIDHAVSRPFADAILTPAAFRKYLGSDHYTFQGFKESAYLHPAVFDADPSVRAELGLDPGERFVVLRLNAFGSHHDVGQGGFTGADRRRLVERLAEDATVLVSDEGNSTDFSSLPARPFDLHPARLHDALAAASLLVADTQTMVTEAALLGTPAVRSNSFVGEDDMGNFLELEEAGLVVNARSFDRVLDAVDSLLAEGVAAEWRERRDDYVAGTVDVSRVLADVAESPTAIEAVDGISPAGRRR